MSIPQKPILIIEDSEAIRSSLQEFLEFEGYTVFTAIDGQNALKTLPELSPPPFLIILDLNMPRMNGEEFLQKKAELGLAPEAKVAIFAAIPSYREIPGVDTWVKKPVELDDLLRLLERYKNN